MAKLRKPILPFIDKNIKNVLPASTFPFSVIGLHLISNTKVPIPKMGCYENSLKRPSNKDVLLFSLKLEALFFLLMIVISNVILEKNIILTIDNRIKAFIIFPNVLDVKKIYTTKKIGNEYKAVRVPVNGIAHTHNPINNKNITFKYHFLPGIKLDKNITDTARE